MTSVASADTATALLTPLPSVNESSIAAGVYAHQQDISLSQAETNLQLQDQAGDIAAELEAKLGSTYAGLWFDAQHGQFDIDLAPATSRAAAEEVVTKLGLDDATTFNYVNNTWQQVEAAARTLSRKLASPSAPQQVAVITSPQANAPLIEVANDASASVYSQVQVDAASASVPATIVRVSPQELAASPDVCNFPNCDMPLKGGVQIHSGTDPEGYYAICTAGVETEEANHYQYVLTAGHCFQGSSYWNYPYNWHATNSNGEECELGPPIASEVSTKGDAGVIAAPRGCNSIEPEIVEWGVIENYPIKAQRKAYVGLFQCHMGEHSENQCGDVEAVNVTVAIAYSTGTIEVEHMDKTCALALPGDSGGPVQYGNLEWTYITGITIASNEKVPASCSEGARMWSYELEYAEHLIGVKLVTDTG